MHSYLAKFLGEAESSDSLRAFAPLIVVMQRKCSVNAYKVKRFYPWPKEDKKYIISLEFCTCTFREATAAAHTHTHTCIYTYTHAHTLLFSL